MCIAQTMTPTSFSQLQDDWSRWLWTAICMWWLLSGPVFYRARLARTVILIEEAWDCDTGSGEEGPC
jgi:hypothetical protein